MARVPLPVAYHRAVRLLCPRCGRDPLFASFFRMKKDCAGCGHHYEREPGYFLGTIYINYGWTSASMSAAYVLFHIVLDLPNLYVLPPLCVYVVVFPMLFQRYARAFWVAFDCHWDHTELEGDDGTGNSPVNAPEEKTG